ncbi:MAG: CAP domain-containing protein [Thermoleophilaceae bacterium]
MGAGHRAALAAAYATLLAFGASASAAARCPEARSVGSGSDNAGAVAETVCAINAERRAAGVTSLHWNSRLAVAAERMAADMAARDYFGHVTRGGQDLAARVAAAGYVHAGSGWPVGENIGWGSGDLATPESMVARWLASPGHRRNLLNPGYSELGIGVVHGSPMRGDDAGSIFVADFGSASVTTGRRHSRRRTPRSARPHSRRPSAR